MDREQEEMQSLGLSGIYAEAYILIFRQRMIFGQIILALIIPLYLIVLAHQEMQVIIYIKFTPTELHDSQVCSPRYNRFSELGSSGRVLHILYKAVYFTSLLVSFLLSTSTVVYIVASAYTDREITFKKVVGVIPLFLKRLFITCTLTFFGFFACNVVAALTQLLWGVVFCDNSIFRRTNSQIILISEITFKKVMSVVPRVWRRLMITFLCISFGFLAYSKVFSIILSLCNATFVSILGQRIMLIIVTSYLIGLVYLATVCQLASVVTVLEDSYGFKAIIKSKDLIKGKMVVATLICFNVNLCLIVVSTFFRAYVVNGWRELGTMQLIGVGALCLLLLSKLILFSLVVQTVFYFVCKSNRRENIDKTALSDYLEVNFGEHMNL